VGRVERLADDDGVVDSVVVAEYGARAALRPSERRLFDLPVEKAMVQSVEHPSEVVDATLCRGDGLAPALPPREVGGAQHFGRVGVVAVGPLVEGRRASAQEFGNEYEGERAVDAQGCALEDV